MVKSLKRRIALSSVSLVAVTLSAACSSISVPLIHPAPANDNNAVTVAQPANVAQPGNVAQPANLAQATPQTTAPATTGASTQSKSKGPQLVPVKRDTLTETLSIDGSVAAQDQVTITVPGRNVINDVVVKAGQTVKAGDALLTLAEEEHGPNIRNGAIALEDARNKLAAAQAQAAADQQAAAAAAAAAQAASKQQQQLASVDLQAALRHAQENLAKVQAGPTQADRQNAQLAVQTAQAALQKAYDAQAKLTSGPDPDAVRTAQRDLNLAQIAYQKAQSDLATLTAGPDPGAMRTAQAQLQQAQTQLQLAQLSKPDPKTDPAVAQVQHAAAVQGAQLAVQAAQANIDTLKRPPADVDVQAAKQKVQDAQAAVNAAKDKLTSLGTPPDQDVLDAAQTNIDNAQKAVQIAQAALDQINNHPTPSELADAQDQVRKAQNALDAASRGAAPPPAATSDGPDLTPLQAEVAKEEAYMQFAQQYEDSLIIKAPFDGTVLSIKAHPNDTITSVTQLLVLAKNAPPVVTLQPDDSQMPQLKEGQQATIQIGGGSQTAKATATVETVTPAAIDGSTPASVRLKVNWPKGPLPRFGTQVQATVTIGQKENVLVVPNGALRQSGGTPSVEVQDGTIRRLVKVQTGIETDSETEITSGLTEGQQVLVAASVP